MIVKVHYFQENNESTKIKHQTKVEGPSKIRLYLDPTFKHFTMKIGERGYIFPMDETTTIDIEEE